MSRFTLEQIQSVKGKLKVYKLAIDGKCEFDGFCNALQRQNKNDVIIRILATLDSYANLTRLPASKFRDLKKPKSDSVKEYEIKTGKYRVYLFKVPNGATVVLGGIKTNQKKDLKRFRSVKSEYIKHTKDDHKGTTS